MAKGPSYTAEEREMLDKIAVKGGSPTVLAKKFVEAYPSNARTEAAIVQKIRKMIIALDGTGKKSKKKAAKKAKPKALPKTALQMNGTNGHANGKGKAKGKARKTPKVNAKALSDETVPAVVGGAKPFVARKNKRKGKPAVNGNGNGKNGHHLHLLGGTADVVTADLGGLTLVGSKKRVGEALQQLA